MSRVPTCGKCQEALLVTGDYVSCWNCKRNYHYKVKKRQCSGLAVVTYTNMSQNAEEKWKCQAFCCQEIAFFPLLTPDSLNTPTSPCELSVVETMGALKEIKCQLQTLTESVDFLSNKHDQFCKELEEVKKEGKERDKIIKKLTEENRYLYHELNKTKEELQDLQQYNRNKNVELHGIEEREKENVMDIVRDVAEKLRLPKDIDVAHRLKSKKKKEARQ